MIKKSVTMSDIANEIGVSTVTVSKALGDKDGVGSELREKIKQKANEMGYRFSSASKSSKDNLTYSISVVVAKHFIHDASAFYWVVYRYIVELLQKQSYYGILEVVSDSDEQLCEMPKSITDKKVDGIIVLGQFRQSYASALLNMNVPTVFGSDYKFSLNKAVVLKEGTDITLFVTGDILAEVLKASEILEEKGLSVQVVNIPVIKPLDVDTIVESASKTKHVFTIENHSIIGGLGSAVCECLSEKAPKLVHRIGVNDCFGQTGTPNELLKCYGLDAESIADRIIELIK